MAKNLKSSSLIKQSIDLNGRDLVIETGEFAQLADGSALVRFGDRVVLATVVVSDEPKEDAEYFPLLVDFEERLYASGKISGSRFYKREGRPSEDAIVMARMIDRPIRPLFPKNYRNDIQIVVTALSYDPDAEIEVPAIIAASTALSLTGAHFAGPIGAVKIGLIKDEFVMNPTTTQLEESQMDLMVVGTKERIIMVECEGEEVPTEKIFEALQLAQKEMQSTISLQEKFIKKAGQPERHEYIAPDPALMKNAKEKIGAELKKAITLDREAGKLELDRLKNELLGALEGDFKKTDIAETFEQLHFKAVRERILKEQKRPGDRKPDEIRPLTTSTPDFPRTHGAGLFQRGYTQLVSVVTLASLSKEGLTDTMTTEGKQQFFHHYNFPPFSVGEIFPMRGPGRREIGHGRLGEKAIKPVLPKQEDFPYVIRIVSEALSSDGSTSMAAVCSSSMALMNAGVPIKRPVSGIAVGLVTDSDKKGNITDYQVLTDIQGLEDFLGDMDLKIAGTEKGITCMQLDMKVKGITFEIIKEALDKSDQARAKIRQAMAKTIAKPSTKLSKYAPKIEVVKIDPSKIGEVIGPGGKIINKIIEDTGCEINIEDDGMVSIGSTGEDANIKLAVETVMGLGTDPEIGKVHEGTVMRTEDFGAFVEFLPGKEGLVHISELSDKHIDKVTDVVKVGDKIPVMVTEIDDRGRINLSYRSAKKK